MEFAWSDGGGTQVDRGRRSFWVLGNSIFIHFPIRILRIRRVLERRAALVRAPSLCLSAIVRAFAQGVQAGGRDICRYFFFFVKVAEV